VCGIAGALDWAATENEMNTVLGRMASTLHHRGPDDGGRWCDPDRRVGLAHRRLAILDLSEAGHQPMASPDGRLRIAFNGEIYNFREIREALTTRGYGFKGGSDTEVLLAAVAEWGVAEAARRCVGMFAFAVWDAKEERLRLVRDRLGEKPLYYGRAGGVFLFGSELKAMRAHPAWDRGIDRGALALLLRYGYIPSPHTIYEGIHKLPPGTVLTVTPGRPGTEPAEAYWSLPDLAEAGRRDPFQGTPEEAADELEGLLRQAVRGQMVADVPVGAFLSGGIDSSTVVALMQAEARRPVRTFSVGFAETGFDEAPHAKAVAAHLGTDHTELYVTPQQAMEVIPRLPQLYDEPFADVSQIPTFLVSELARRHVTVSLSGDGGDELFGGYKRVSWGRSIWRKVGWVPRPLRRAAAGAATAVTPEAWNATFKRLAPLLPTRLRLPNPGYDIHKLAASLGAADPMAFYRGLVSHWRQPASVVLGAAEPATALSGDVPRPCLPDFAERMMFLDLVTYLPDDILVKVDRAAMAVSLESRMPFLDHRVVEFAWRLPMDLKIRGTEGKWLLRQVLYRHVPRRLLERPKMGFGMPIGTWLRGPLRAWAEALLDPARL
jgi:asparagine synthase (glutamine-hydrolysing)